MGRLPSTKVKGLNAEKLYRNMPVWMRVNVDSRKVRTFLNYDFLDWDRTLRGTVDSLIQVGGVQPVP